MALLLTQIEFKQKDEKMSGGSSFHDNPLAFICLLNKRKKCTYTTQYLK